MKSAKEMLDEVTNLKETDQNKFLLDKSKGTLTSAAIGAGVGLLIGYNRHWSLLFSAVGGAVIAGLISNYIVNKN